LDCCQTLGAPDGPIQWHELSNIHGDSSRSTNHCGVLLVTFDRGGSHRTSAHVQSRGASADADVDDDARVECVGTEIVRCIFTSPDDTWWSRAVWWHLRWAVEALRSRELAIRHIWHRGDCSLLARAFASICDWLREMKHAFARACMRACSCVRVRSRALLAPAYIEARMRARSLWCKRRDLTRCWTDRMPRALSSRWPTRRAPLRD
jgi:hypothetical protein